MSITGIPYLSEYFGPWAMLEDRLRGSWEAFQQLDIAVHLQSDAPAKAQAAAESQGKAKMVGNVAEIHLSGVLMKHVSSMEDGTSTVQTRRAIRDAAADPRVQAIMLHVDSPGGTVSGTKDLADEVAAARKRKPVYAYIEDLGASAAYWIASQAEKVFANSTALVGSIGTYAVVHDMSGFADQNGIKVHVIRAGDFKGAGEPGTEITEEQLAEFGRIVSELNGHFLAGVAAGRGMTAAAVKEIADGRVRVGKEARAAGLIDGVQSYEETLNQLSRKGKKMAAATSAEIKGACPGADAEFVLGQIESEATIEAAQTAWIKAQAERLAAAKAEAEAAKEEAAKATAAAEKAKADAAAAAAKPGKPGTQPVADDVPGDFQAGGSATETWRERIAAYQRDGMTKPQAAARVNRECPGLRQRMLEEANGRPVAV